MTEFAISAAAGSEIGRRYRANFDVVRLALDPLVAVVADGMGDGQGSALAGRTTVDVFTERLATARRTGETGRPGGTRDAIRDAVATAQQRVGEIGARIGELTGCTLTALVQSPGGFWIAQIGDSRIYRLRSGLLELLTVDHTMAWLGAVHGWYAFDSPEAASARYRLTRYVGHPDRPEPDLMSVRPAPGDVFLLCSDGVAEQVPYDRILGTLMSPVPPQERVDRLLAAADEAGGRDNASAVVVTVATADP